MTQLAAQRERGLLNGPGDLQPLYGFGRKTQLSKFVDLAKGFDAAVVAGFSQSDVGDIEDKLTGLADEIVRVAGLGDADGDHGRFGIDCPTPGYGHDVGLLARSTGREHTAGHGGEVIADIHGNPFSRAFYLFKRSLADLDFFMDFARLRGFSF